MTYANGRRGQPSLQLFYTAPGETEKKIVPRAVLQIKIKEEKISVPSPKFGHGLTAQFLTPRPGLSFAGFKAVQAMLAQNSSSRTLERALAVRVPSLYIPVSYDVVKSEVGHTVTARCPPTSVALGGACNGGDGEGGSRAACKIRRRLR